MVPANAITAHKMDMMHQRSYLKDQSTGMEMTKAMAAANSARTISSCIVLLSDTSVNVCDDECRHERSKRP